MHQIFFADSFVFENWRNKQSGDSESRESVMKCCVINEYRTKLCKYKLTSMDYLTVFRSPPVLRT